MKTAIFDLENWREIGATLAKNKTRTFLTSFGIFWGTAMLAMLLGGAQGLENIMRRQFSGFATNTAVIQPGRRTISYQGMNKGSSWSITQSDLDMVKEAVPGIKSLAPLLQYGMVNAVNGDKTTSIQVKGESPENMEVYLPRIYEGRYINDSDVRWERKTCVIGKKVASTLFPGESPVGKYVQVDGISYKIVGVAGQQSDVNIGGEIDEVIILPSSTMRRSFQMGDNVGGAMILCEDNVAPSTVIPKIKRIIYKRHKIHPDDSYALFDFDISEQFKMVDNLFVGITILALFVGFSSLIAGIIGIGNIMWVIVKERTQEIGIRRAIGAKPRDIVTQILSEGMMLTFISGIAGICFATLVLKAAEVLTADEAGNQVRFQLEFWDAIAIVIMFVILGTLAGLIPALKSMKIKPIEAMRDK